MSDTIIIRRNGEKFAVDCSTVLEAFNGHLKVKFDGIICPKCGASDSCWIPVRKVEEGGEVAKLKRQRNEALAIASDIDKCASIERHTDAMLKKNEVIVGLRKEVAELRECLKEAIREKCPFTRMSCKHGEPCDYECGTVKWRKALQEEGGAK